MKDWPGCRFGAVFDPGVEKIFLNHRLGSRSASLDAARLASGGNNAVLLLGRPGAVSLH